MDLEKLTHHKHYGLTVGIAIGLSLLIVVAAAVAGRSAVNLKGELVAENATIPVVIQLMERAHPEETIHNVDPMPVRPDIVGSVFIVSTDAGAYYVRVSGTKPWEIIEEKRMHGGAL